MKVENKRRKNWRIVKTPTRNVIDLPILLGGLSVSQTPEQVGDNCVVDVDGFIIYSELFRKDWAVVAGTITLDNTSIVAAASCEECSA